MQLDYLSRYRTIGLNVAYFRKKRGLTQEQLAEKIGVDRSTVGKIETAWSGVSLDVLFRIADELNVEPFKFFIDHD